MFKSCIKRLKRIASHLYPVYGIEDDEEVQQFLQKSGVAKEELKEEINRTLSRSKEIIKDAQMAPSITILSGNSKKIIGGEDLYFFVLGTVLQQRKDLDNALIETKSILRAIGNRTIRTISEEFEKAATMGGLFSWVQKLLQAIKKSPLAKGIAALMTLPDYLSSRLLGYATGDEKLAKTAWVISASAGALWQWGLWGASAITGNPALFALGAIPVVGATGITASTAAALLRLIYDTKKKLS